MRISDWSSDVCSSDLHAIERGPLFTRQIQPALRRLRQRALSLDLWHAMLVACRHQLAGALQPLFGLDHVARREPLLAASVLAEGDQVDRKSTRLNSSH